MYGHVVLLWCCVVHLVTGQSQYVVPPSDVQVLPKGFRVSIPDSPGVSGFIFIANVNERLDKTEGGKISGSNSGKRGDQWIYENNNIMLQPGDNLFYRLYVVFDGLPNVSSDRTYTVGDTVAHSSTVAGKTDADDFVFPDDIRVRAKQKFVRRNMIL